MQYYLVGHGKLHACERQIRIAKYNVVSVQKSGIIFGNNSTMTALPWTNLNAVMSSNGYNFVF